MSHSKPFSNSYHSNHEKEDDSSTVFGVDTVIPDEVPSLPAMAMPPLTASATFTDYLHQQPNNNNNESISSTSIQEESPQSFTSVLLRRINSQHRPAEPSTTTATATRSEGISRSNQHQSSSSSSSRKRPIITNSSVKRKQLQDNSTSTTTKKSSKKRPRRSSRLKRQQPQDQSCLDKSDEEVEDEIEDYDPDEAVINQSSSSSQTSTTKLTKHELKWRSKFEELRAYKQLHGHTNVLQSRDKQLGNWVNRQRHEYRMFKANKHSYMTKDRIEMLESIDFEWVSPNKGGSRNESSWNKRFNELKAYKEKYGHTNVPQNFKDNKQLGRWVDKQRVEYKKFEKNNGKACMTPERIQMLESIGFEWVSPNQGPPRNESAWNEHFNELKAYKEEYNDTNVPIRWEVNKELGKWVSTQRRQYKRFQENKKSQITLERIQTLESIGFEWVSQYKSPRNESAWNKRFNELKAYKDKYNDTNVPYRWEDNKELGVWVGRQRREYKKFQENGKSPITLERIEMLNSIGFQWECRPAPRS